MLAANDHRSPVLDEILNDPCQLRALIAHAAGLLAFQTTARQARDALLNVAAALNDRPTMADIAQEVALRRGVSVEDLRGSARTRWVVIPRHEAMYLIYKTGRFSLPRIGAYFGNRDHTTVLHAVRTHKRRAGL